MRREHAVDPALLRLALRRMKSGAHVRQVGRELGISHSVLVRLRQRGIVQRRAGSGRARILTPAEMRALKRFVKRAENRDRSASYIAKTLTDLWGKSISAWTVQRSLRELGFRSKKARPIPLLTRPGRAARRRYQKEHESWGPREWGRVVYSDEKVFRAKLAGSRRRLWVLDPVDQEEYTVAFPPSQLVWVAIRKDGAGTCCNILAYIQLCAWVVELTFLRCSPAFMQEQLLFWMAPSLGRGIGMKC